MAIGMQRFKIEKLLGNRTQLVRDTTSSQLKVVEEVDLMGDATGMCEKLMALNSLITNVNILATESVFQVSSSIYFVSDYCEGGSLHALIVRASLYEDVLCEEEVLDWFVQITQALVLLHSRGILYKHFTAKNVLLTNNAAKLSSSIILKSKLDDLQQDSVKCESDLCTSATRNVKDEEVRSLVPQTSDIRALGLLLYHMCMLEEFDHDLSDMTPTQRDRLSINFSADLVTLCSRLLTDDSHRIATAKEVLDIPYISSHIKEMNSSPYSTASHESTTFENWKEPTDSSLKEPTGPVSDQRSGEKRGSDSEYNSDDNYITQDDFDELMHGSSYS
jgi:serine/threonine protein kinase